MNIQYFSLITYILISTFTPGPSNISTASFALLRGYKNTIKYQVGLAAGVFILMSVSGLLSTTLLNSFPSFEPVLRYAGAGYILFLAFENLKTTYAFSDKDMKSPGITQGILLQILNPKLIVYAITLFSTFLAPIKESSIILFLIVVLLAVISFCATSMWALFGTVIKNYLHNPGLKTIVNIILSLLLVYTALTLIRVI